MSIKGYRQLSKKELEFINKIKESEESLAPLFETLADSEGIDMRWLSVARTHLQQGFMAAVRSVAKPETGL